jgi:hypothetical protein
MERNAIAAREARNISASPISFPLTRRNFVTALTFGRFAT